MHRTDRNGRTLTMRLAGCLIALGLAGCFDKIPLEAANGSTADAAGSGGPCTPQTEICNGKDDDCDGLIDEAGAETGCPAGGPCTVAVCAAGACSVALDTKSTAACDDASACTSDDACKAGACVGTAKNCDDGKFCTADGCDAKSGCSHQTAAGPCDDGNTCTTDTCELASGCAHASGGGTCNDGNACTVNDACAGAVCTGTPDPCDDKDVCTVDSCALPGGCKHTNTGVALCNDGDVCTADSCDAAAGCQFKPGGKNCDDSDACTTDSCHPVSGCAHLAFAATACDDAESCTDDSCVAATGCIHAANALSCSDGSKCTVGDVCVAKACKPGDALACDDNNPCTDDSCDAATGCIHANNTAQCTDNNGCTVGDVCAAGVCKPGPATVWDATVGTLLADRGRAVAATSDGGAVVAGYGGSASGDVGKLTRWGAHGEQKWDKSYGGGASGKLNSVVVGSDGGILAAGSLYVSGQGQKLWVVRTSAEGEVVWDKTFGVSGAYSTGRRAVFTAQGVAIAGDKGAVSGDDHPWLVLLDPDGNKKGDWVDTASTASLDDLVVTKNGDLALLAGTQLSLHEAGGLLKWQVAVDGIGSSWATTFLAPTDDKGFVIASEYGKFVRLDAAGAPLWSRNHEDLFAGNASLAGLVTTPDGGFACSGWTDKTGNGATDFRMHRLDSAGNVLWARTYGGASYDEARGIAVLADKGFFLTGTTMSKGAGDDDVWLVRTDAWGNATCAEAGDCAAKTVAECDDGNACSRDDCTLTGGCVHPPHDVTWSCSDGNTCTAGDLCAGLACEPGPLATWDKALGGAGDDTAVGVAARPDGGFLAAGMTFGSKPNGLAGVWLAGVDASGKPTVDKVYPSDTTDQVRAVASNGDGYALAGTTGSAGWLFLVDAKGENGAAFSFKGNGSGAGASEFTAMTRTAPGDLLLVGHTAATNNPSGTDAWVVLVDSEGYQLDAVQTSGLGDERIWAVANNGPSYVVAGEKADVAGGAAHGWLWDKNWSPDGTFSCEFPEVDSIRAVSPVAFSDPTVASKVVVVAGRKKVKTLGTQFWWALVDVQNCVVTKEATFGDTEDDDVYALASVADGGYALVGNSGGAYGDLWFIRVDGNGNQLWDHTYGGSGPDVARAVLVTGNTGYLIAGTTASKGAGKTDAWLVRTDPWGHETCTASGLCAGKDSGACDDKNPCTQDSCSPVTGCNHTVVSAGTPCDDGHGCSSNDVCDVGGTCSGAPTTCPAHSKCVEYPGYAAYAYCECSPGFYGDVDTQTCQCFGTEVPITTKDGATTACAYDWPVWGPRAAIAPLAEGKTDPTGLQWSGWEDDAGSNGDGMLSWSEAVAYCDARTYQGASDWRLPTAAELESALDYGLNAAPVVISWKDTYGYVSKLISGMPGADLWTTVDVAGDTGMAWLINFGSGVAERDTKTAGHYAVCVRTATAPKPPQPRFVDRGDGRVADVALGIDWQAASPSGGGDDGAGRSSHANALAYCDGLALGGQDDWRLPAVRELYGLLDRTKGGSGPAVAANYFPNTPQEAFWSGTDSAMLGYKAWQVEFGHGDSMVTAKTAKAKLRCVRDITGCGNKKCEKPEESTAICPADCPANGFCGDGICSGVEDTKICPNDCGGAPTCGDGTCNGTETIVTCPGDCLGTTKCGDGTCNGLETNASCPGDCTSAHYCDSHCGGQSSAGCWCDSECPKFGDCCNFGGTTKAGKACTGSTCTSCNPP